MQNLIKNSIDTATLANGKAALLKASASLLTLAAVIAPGAAHAADAVNTATITLPGGVIDPNTTNNSFTDTDTISASVIVAANDTVTGINGFAGATSVVNAFTGDTINGVAASAANATLTAETAVPAGLTFNTATGAVDVAAGTAAGTYTFTYKICETVNPTNCKTATISVTVVAAAILADPDTPAAVNGATGANDIVNAYANDKLNGVTVDPTKITGTVTTPATPATVGAPVPVLDPATGLVDVPAGTPAGTYTIAYEICETLNPANCSSSSITVIVAPSAIVATNDTVTGVNGFAGGTSVVNAFTSDLINGAAASATNAILSAETAVPAGLTFNTATGAVDVAAGTAAGTYTFDYKICEKLNPTNCKVATISVTVVAALIEAAVDTPAAVNGATGSTNVVNAYTNDKLNGVAVDPTKITGTVTTPATPASVGAPVPTLNPATGQVDVPAGTPAGTYTIAYEICETLNPANCSSSSITVIVAPSAIVAANDTVTGVNGFAGATSVVNAFTSDLINGAAASATNAILSAETAVPAGLTFNTATGAVDVAAGTAAGTYTFDYKICEKLNPTNCKVATISVTVVAAAILAEADTPAAVNGATGATNIVNAYTNDKLNGVAVDPTKITGTVTTPATPATVGAPVPTLNAATGQVDVPAGTPAGTYTIAYEICETLNPANCSSSSITVVVDPSTIVATGDTVTGVNGVAGATAVLNVFTGDTVNGATASATNAILSAETAVPAGLTFNTATGAVDVAAGTPSGTYTFDYKICEKLNPTNCKIATASVTVSEATDLVLTKSNGVSALTYGQSTTYTITVVNNGPNSSTGALVKDTIVSGLTCPVTNGITFGGTGFPVGSFTIGDLTGPGITLGTIGNGQTVTLSYTCTVTLP